MVRTKSMCSLDTHTQKEEVDQKCLPIFHVYQVGKYLLHRAIWCYKCTHFDLAILVMRVERTIMKLIVQLSYPFA